MSTCCAPRIGTRFRPIRTRTAWDSGSYVLRDDEPRDTRGADYNAEMTRLRSNDDKPSLGGQGATSLTPEGYDKARRLLMRRDPILAVAIKQIGPCGMADRQRTDHLSALVGAI